MNKPMKVFKAEHDGKMVFGLSLVVASSRQQALKLVRKTIQELKADAHKVDFDEDLELTEIDITTPAVHVLFDGIY